ncbi:MAG: endopeptidase La [Vulcanimicrobiota bacterium]
MKATYPMVTLRNAVLFPYAMMPITVGRPSSQEALRLATEEGEGTLFVVTQKDPVSEEPTRDELYPIGTLVKIQKIYQHGRGMEVLLTGISRARLLDFDKRKSDQDKAYMEAEVEVLPPLTDEGPEVDALHRELIETAKSFLDLAGRQGQSLMPLTDHIKEAIQLAYFAATVVGLSIENQQRILEAGSRREVLQLSLELLKYELEVFQVRKQISSNTREKLDQEQREAILRRQMHSIREELGDDASEAEEVELFRKRLTELELPTELHRELKKEIDRLERSNSASPDYQITRSYIELALDLPWKNLSEDEFDLKSARGILNEDHHGLEEIKERILEHLAVMRLNPDARAPILLFVGPPGVGKTSLGQSIARAMGRKFERVALGGLSDEAELRGHRRTYVGAMPGRLLTALRRAGTRNPVLMLDEVDKLGRGFRGDPAAALLEVVDPAQNDKFRDNYLDLPFDLSKTTFIMTANTTDTIPSPLLDRMEIVRLSGYSEEEKFNIARRYLLPRQLEQSGLEAQEIEVTDEALQELIRSYTREAGVRALERAIGKLARKLALRRLESEETIAEIGVEKVHDLLGPDRLTWEEARDQDAVGVATGLAWTPAGGDVLYVEVVRIPSGKGLTVTGQLGEVMSESVKAAQSIILSRAEEFGISPEILEKGGLHVHVPAGAIPKDGPSAGVTMVTALASVYTGVPIRHDVAMTGEVTLSGLVLPVGGIKEKVLAARRRGIRTVILPALNRKDLEKLDSSVREEMEFVLVEQIEQVLETCLPEVSKRLGSSKKEKTQFNLTWAGPRQQDPSTA